MTNPDPTFKPGVVRRYLHFVEAKHRADFNDDDSYSRYALNVVMDYIADHIEEPSIQGLAETLGEWEVDSGS